MSQAIPGRWRRLPEVDLATPRRVWAIAGAIIVLTVAAVALAIGLLYQSRHDHLTAMAATASELAAEQTQTVFDAARLQVWAVKRELRLRQEPTYWVEHSKELEEFLDEVYRVNPQRAVFDLIAIAPSGHILALPASPDAKGTDVSDQAYFQAVADGAERFLAPTPVAGPASGVRTLPYVEPVRDASGQPAFFLGARIHLPAFERLHAGITADGVPAASALFRDDGVFLAGTWPAAEVDALEEDGGWVLARAEVPGWSLMSVAGTPERAIWRGIALPSATLLGAVVLLSVGVILVAQIWQQRQRAYAALQGVEGQQRVLLAELNHRVKNVLATVQSIAAQTARGSASLEEFERAFEGRLGALSRTSTLLAVNSWRTTELRTLVEAALEPYRAPDGNVRVHGPATTLPPKAALTLSLALHELATNAAKYGALSVPEGRVDVTWRVDEDGAAGRRLALEWAEHGGAAVRAPDRRGFGRTLIERSVAYELGGTARLDFPPEGVRCRIEVPLPAAAP